MVIATLDPVVIKAPAVGSIAIQSFRCNYVASDKNNRLSPKSESTRGYSARMTDPEVPNWGTRKKVALL